MTAGILIEKPLNVKDLPFTNFYICELSDISCTRRYDRPQQKMIILEKEDYPSYGYPEGYWSVTEIECEINVSSSGKESIVSPEEAVKIVNKYVKKLKTHTGLWIVGRLDVKANLKGKKTSKRSGSKCSTKKLVGATVNKNLRKIF